MRVNLDDRNESMGFKTRHTQKSKIPFMAVIGDKEIQSGTVSLRKYGAQDSTTVSLDEMKKLFNDLNKEILPKNLRD